MAWIRARGRAGDGVLPSQLRWHAVGARGRRFVGRRSLRTRAVRGVGNSINLSCSAKLPSEGITGPSGPRRSTLASWFLHQIIEM